MMQLSVDCCIELEVSWEVVGNACLRPWPFFSVSPEATDWRAGKPPELITG
jgi:hypothetical protein